MTQISDLDQLIEYIKSNDLTIDQINRLTSATIGCYLSPLPKNELIQEIETYYNQWKEIPLPDRPLFTS
jgi:3'-phosphoadenosine 5'-phosphosulfate sulfotransferase (PAPS reductase)/FAD synthetase